ncbi:MAG TPA: hypothetical protein VFQ43_04525, partial [Nitrososphaera sp.]|nr:hypothetical protein [Nitrososphaera sp.]
MYESRSHSTPRKKSPPFRKEREKDGAPPAITRRSMSDNKYYVNYAEISSTCLDCGLLGARQ